MESRGDNSIGERNSGADSNKGNINFMEGAEVESNVALQNGNIYANISTKSKEDYTISIDARENIALEDGGFPLAGMMPSSHSDSDIRRLKPLLEIDNNSNKSSSSSTPCGREMMHPLVDERRIAGNTCLTMSLGLYQAKASDMDINGPTITSGMNATNCTNGTNGHSVYNMPGMFMSPFELNTEERNQFKMSGCANPRQLLQKHHHMNQLSHPDTFEQSQLQVISRSETPNASPHVPIRVARPPIEGRGRNQLLPRYWPRITDQELQQITARDSNSTITPLFEKMLSASDAGRIGRLVLPKACAEAYFPPISQPEGVSLKIQDVSGKDWVFQFRFWPNNNSRMYVLEGVTPCIQSMQLQAGDTVTFSRLDPEGKLVMGFRKAPSSLSLQETAGTPGVPSFINNGSIDSFPTISSLTGLLSQSVKNSEARANGHLNVSDTGYGWFNKAEKGGLKAKEGPLFQSLLAGDKKSRPSSSKNKRPSTDEAVEFRITWEEAQDLLRSPPNVSPNIVTIEGFVFEEYEEPPVFGKRTIFTSKILGPGEDQWAQCDDCGSWRKVPSTVFLPTRWVCADNVWDTERNSCNDPQEIDSEEIECLVQHVKDIKKPEVEELPKTNEPLSGLEALANAATDTAGENSTVPLSPATTTKHPRHRPGCSCIVCIQPPSGKGPKHKPTCTCNVCMTVKRRFKTLMMRRKKRQLEREAEHAARKKRPWTKEDCVGDVGSGGGNWKNESYLLAEGIPRRQGNLSMALPNMLPMASNLPPNANGYRFSSNMPLQPPYNSTVINFIDEFKGHFDLNGQPERDEEMHKSAFRMSMMRLLQSASHPLESYLKEQGLTSLIGTQQQFMHPSMSFSRSVTERETERHHNTMNYATSATSLERMQGEDHLYMTLGLPRFSTPEGSLPPTLMHY